jgi:hypothetical protein
VQFKLFYRGIMTKTPNIFDELIDRMGGCPDYERDSTEDDVYETYSILADREWMVGVRFALSQCFTSDSDRKILGRLSDVEYTSMDRYGKVKEIIKELFGENV